jgi:hypothetical protein
MQGILMGNTINISATKLFSMHIIDRKLKVVFNYTFKALKESS